MNRQWTTELGLGEAKCSRHSSSCRSSTTSSVPHSQCFATSVALSRDSQRWTHPRQRRNWQKVARQERSYLRLRPREGSHSAGRLLVRANSWAPRLGLPGRLKWNAAALSENRCRREGQYQKRARRKSLAERERAFETALREENSIIKMFIPRARSIFQVLL